MRDTHQRNTRHPTQNAVTLNQYKTAFYGTHSIKHQLALIWNQMNNEAPSDPLQKSRSEISCHHCYYSFLLICLNLNLKF